MKKFKVKVFLISMILLITGGITGVSLADGAATIDEFAELESSYESTSPKLNAAELSSTFTSEKEIEVYLETSRNDIEKIVISAWSGGAYSKFKTTKNATYDATREIYTATFNLDEIINTNTGAKENAEEAIYSFDACVYGTNKTMSYYNLDNVQYTEKGFLASTKTSGDNVELTVKAEEDGEIAVLKDGEEVGENTVWQSVKKGENTISLMSLEDETNEDAMSSNVQTYSVVYKSPKIVSMPKRSIPVVTTNSLASSSTFQNDDIFSFEISQSDGLNTWMSYEDTPNIFESTIQGKHGETATAVIKIYTEHAGILSFDYMSSSEIEFDIFSFEIRGATLITEGGRSNTEETKIEQTGEKDWKNYTGEFDIPSNGVITLTLKYKKDKNVNRYEDKAAIRNLIFTPILPSNGSVIINDGAEYTGSVNLDLKIYVEDATYMYISENDTKPSVNSSEWEPLVETTTYTLQNMNDGEKTIYVWFKNDSNAMSIEPAKATIKLDNSAPTNDVPTVESTATEIKIKLNQKDENEFVLTEYGYRLVGTTDFTWSGNVNSGEHIMVGLTPMKEYEVKTRVSDGINDVVESEITKVKTKIPSDKIVIESSPSEKTLNNVIVTITWNNSEGYTQEYSLDGINYTKETNTVTTIEMPKNGIIYYQMNNGTYDTGVQKYIVGNIDREGPVVEVAEVVSPKSGKYGIGDGITLKITWNEEIYASELPKLNIKFNDDVNIPLTAEYKTTNEIVYKYTIRAEDYGILNIVSLEGGEVKDSLQNIASYELPNQTGSEIFAENAAYIAATNTYYATIQNAVNAAGTEPTIIKVTANTELRNTITIKENQNITLDLNGKTVSIKNDSSIVTAIENSGTLVIKDTTNTIGEITAYSKERSAYTIINNGTGALTIENGKITAVSNSESVALKSYAIYDKEAGVVTLGINDDIVSSTSPEIKATSKNSVGIRLVDASGRLYYSDGIIKGTSESLELASGATAYIMPVGYMEKIETQTEEYGIYKVSYLSNENVVELTIDGKTEKYMTLIEALSRVPADGRLAEIKMLADDTLQEIAKIYEGQNIVIDLNGHTITRNKAVNGIIYGMLNNGTLTIKDTQGTGKIQAITDKDIPAYAVYNYTNGTLTLENATLFAKNGGTNEAYGLDYGGEATAIINIATETVKIYRDTLEKDKKYLNPLRVQGDKYLKQGTEIVDGITYKVNYGSAEPNVSLTVNDTVTYYNSVQQAVNAAPTDGTLGEIQVLDDEELYTFIDVIATKNVSIDLNGKTLLSKGETQAVNNSGNLNIKDTSENQTGLIHATSDVTRAYGIANGAKILEINSGTIMSTSTLNTAGSAFGIYTGNANGTIIINGGKLKGMTNGIHIPAVMLINNSGDIQTGKVNLPQGKHISYTIEGQYIVNTLADGEIVATLEQNGVTRNYVSIQDAVYNAVAEGTLAKITMYQSESLGRQIDILEGHNIEIDLNGNEIYKGPTGKVIENKGNLTISDSSNGEGKITAITNSANNTAINNAGTGTITINGGNISFQANVNFTTINNASTGKIIINGGKIIGNSPNGTRRLIYNASSGTIQINSGELLSETTSTGIVNKSTGYIEINGGRTDLKYTVISNESTGNVVINGGNIGATIVTEHSAINNASTGSITINDGVISVYSRGNAISNGNLGYIYIYGGIVENQYVRGIGNSSKGKIVIGKDDGIVKNEPVIIGNRAIHQTVLGGEVYFYDGIIKSSNSYVVYPNETKFRANETPTEAYYLIMTTDDAYLKYGKEDSYYTISYTDVENYELSYKNGSENVVKKYASLKTAMDEAPDNIETTIKVLNNNVEEHGVTITKNQKIVLDLNGKKIVFEELERAISNTGILKIIDSIEDENGGIEAFNTLKTSIAIYQKGTLILGEDDGIVSNNKPIIIANKNAVENQNNTTIMYDGRLIGSLPIFNNASSTFTVANGYKTKITTLDNAATKELYLVKQEGITIVPETSEFINKDLNVSINYSNSNLIYKYKINDDEWKEATHRDTGTNLIIENISVSENCTIYAQSLDTNGNVVYSEEYEITNIDKTAPSIENVSITTSVATSQTITITGIKDNENGSGIKSYIVTMDNQAPLESAEWIENAEESITAEVTKNGTWYIYVKDNAGNIGSATIEATNIDIDAPIVSNIEVISPATGNYFMNEVITMQVNFSEEIVVSGTPTLKIKFGEGEERELTSSNITSNAITYTYTVKAEDEGELTLIGYSGDGIKDIAGNDYQDTEIELIGSKITVGTRAYIVETNTYYVTLKDAIAACSTEALEYTTIKLINNDEYEDKPLEIIEGQKIILDLNGKALTINGTDFGGITNKGDLTITDTSENQNGAITVNAKSGAYRYGITNNSEGRLQIDGGTITLIKADRWTANNYTIQNNGTLEINGGTINLDSANEYAYGLYIGNANANVIINGGEFKGRFNGIYKPDGMIINNTSEATNGKITIPANKHIAYKLEGDYIINYLEDAEYVATLEINGETTNYLSLNDAVYAVPADGTLGKITMYQSESLYNTLVINEGQNIEIDLNGNEVYSYHTYNINNKGTLKITDSSEKNIGKLTKGTDNIRVASLYNAVSVIYNTGNLTVEKFEIFANSDNVTSGITNVGTGNVNIFDVIIDVISSNEKVYGINSDGNGTVDVNGSNVKSNQYGLYIKDTSAKIIITSGEFKGRDAGIYIPSGMSISNSGTYESGKVNIPENTHIGYRIEDEYIVNFIEEGNIVATLEVSGEVTNYLSIYDALADAPTDGTYAKITMYQNEYLRSTINILEGQNIEIDLNGKELYWNILAFAIKNNGDVIISDTSEDKTGRITANSDDLFGSAMYGIVYNAGNGTLELNGGYLSVSTTVYTPINAIYNNGEGTIVLSGAEIYSSSTHDNYGIYNKSNGNIMIVSGNINVNLGNARGIYNNNGKVNIVGGNVLSSKHAIENENGIIELNGGEINSSTHSTLRNIKTGSIVINDGLIKVIGTGYNVKAIENVSTGSITINGGTICGRGSGIINFSNSNSEFKITGGTLINTTVSQMFNPSNKAVELPENTYLKISYVQSGDSYVYVGELDQAGDYELTVSGVGTSYYNTLQQAFDAAPTDGTFSKIKLLTDCELSSDVYINSGKYVQLDLNGHSIKYYATTKEIKAFVNNSGQTFEIVDTSGDGIIDVKAEGYNATAVNNNSSSGRIKIISGKIQVKSIGKDAYGIYNHNGLSNTLGDEAIKVEGGNISVKSEIGTDTTVSGKAYGIYNRQYGGIAITGKNTTINSTSTLNDSYGIYNADTSAATIYVTIGKKDDVASLSSPYIAGETYGLYINKAGRISLYDGAITGNVGGALKTSTSSDATAIISNIEQNTFVYTKDNNDGTETVTLLKNIQSLEVKPDEILSNNLSTDYTLDISYMPVDAADVKLQVESSDVNIAVVNELDEGVYSVRTKACGSGEITITATDLSGKVLTETVRVIIDTNAPTEDAPSATSTGSSVTITCNQEDENLDKNEIYYAISEDNGATWSTWSKRATINGLKSDTMYLVKTKASDLLGNVSESETTEIRTKLANNSKFTFNPDTMTRENVLVTITWNNPQGTPQYYKIGSGEWIEEVNETTSIMVSENGVTIYTKLIYDGTEESDIKSATVDNIDRIAPTGTLSINEENPRYDGLVTLNITTQDDTYIEGDNLGVVAYMYITEENLSEAPAENDEGWIKYEGDYDAYEYYIQSINGEGSIYVWLMDKAHNTSETALVATIEFVPPIAVLFEDDVLVGEYQSIAEAYNAARTGNINPSTIIVCKDNTMSSALTIAANKNIILDLNGKHINISQDKAITNNGTLEITDSKKGGTFTNINANAYTIYNNKKLKLSGGTIEGINTIANSNNGFTIYNSGANAKFEMTGGNIYAKKKGTNSNENYGAFAIINNSSYKSEPAVKITGGTIEAIGIGSTCAYGIRNENIGETVITNVTIKVTSETRIGYGIHSLNNSTVVTLGIDDGTVRNSNINISGSTYGLYRQNGTLNFYDGTIKGEEGKSIFCATGYVKTPTNYGISRTVENKIETATLVYDSYAPTVESIEVSNIENSNTQIVTAKGVSDYGTGIVGYQFTTTDVQPAVTDTKWITVTQTNGPEEYSKTITTNGKHYFWAIDAAGNVSTETSIEVNNIKVKATKVTMTGLTLEIGEENTLVPTLTPTDAEPKNILFTSSDDSIAYVDPETGVVTGIAKGTVTIKCNVSNYDDTYVSTTCTVTVTEPVIDIPETQTAPTLETGHKQITATCNQTGNDITTIYYAISTDDFSGDIGTWQISNVFTNLEEGQKYYVKTKIVTVDGEVESVSAMTILSVYKASLEENSVVTYYTSAQDAIDAANTSGEQSKVKLLNTETRDAVVTVASGKNISLDLNGNDLVMVSTANADFRGLTNNGTLEIIDSVGGGEIKSALTSTAGNYYVFGIYNDAGTLTVKGGTITGTNPESKKTYARGICNVNGAITTIGEDDGIVSTTIPKIVSNGIGLYNSNGTLNYNDGLVIGNKGTAISGTINVVSNYKIKEENTDVQTTAYLEEIVIDESKAMITTWNIPAGTTVKLPISSATNMNIIVDWGDGTSNQYINKTFPAHTYEDAREYTIKVQGTCEKWGWSSWTTPGSDYSSYNNYLTQVNAWGELGATQYGFAHCTNLNYVSSDITEKSLENINTMNSMFFKCTSLTSLDLSRLNTKKVTSLQSAFEKCTGLTKLDISTFDTSSVVSLESLVYGCTNLKELKLGNIDTSKVTTTRYMIRDCTSLEYVDFSGLDFSNVINMDLMFINDKALKSILVNETFVVPTTSGSMFNNNTSLKAIILTSKEPTAAQFTNAVSKVPSQTIFYVPNDSETKYETAWGADYSVDKIEPILELIGEESIVVNTRREFVDEGCKVADYTVDNSGDYTVYGYEVNTNEDFDHTVEGNHILTYTLTRTYNNGTETEEVAKVTRNVESIDMDAYMITEWTISGDNTEIKLPVSGTGLNIVVDWGDGTTETITGNITAENFPTHTYAVAGTYDIKVRGTCPKWGYDGWDNIDTTSPYYTYSEYLTGLKQWGELSANRYLFVKCANLKYVSGDLTENTFANVNNMSSMFRGCTSLESVDLSNFDTSKVGNMADMFYDCSSLTELDLSSFNTPKLGNMYHMFNGCTSLEKLDISSLDTSNVTWMLGVFKNCKSLKEIDLSNFRTTSATSMDYMFTNCRALKSLDLSTFETQNVTGMYSMFGGCSELENLILPYMDNSKVRDMRYVFSNCKKLTNIDLSRFGTSAATNMQGMFLGCSGLTSLDLSNFNTSKVETFDSIFNGCTSLQTLNVSSFNTSSASVMSSMFANCSSLTELDLSNFDTSNVTNMNNMFGSCSSLKEIDLSGFNTSNVTDMGGMFSNCTSLENANLSNFDVKKVKNMRYMFSGCTNLKELDLSSFKTDSLTGTLSMFSNNSSIETIDLSNMNTKNVTDMGAMFISTSSLKSILIGENFVVSGDAGGVFWQSAIKSIITTSSTPVPNQFKGEIPSTATLYVPNGSEEAYAQVLSGDTDASKIKPIIEPIGETEVGMLVGTSYEEQNYTVAGFGIEDAKYYMAYGYDVKVSGDVNTNECGTYKIEYTLTRTYTDENGVQKEERHTATRTVYVYDSPIVHLYENNKSYYGDWTNQDVVAIMKILSPQTTWVSVKVENGDWTEEPSYADIVKSGEQMVVTFHESLNGKVYFKEVDVTGNATTYQSEPSIIKIDKEKPVVQDMTAKTIDGVIKLEAKVFDNLSGIEKYSIMQSGETQIAWKEYDRTDGKIEEILPSSGTYYLWLKDVAGNVSSGDYMNVIKDVEAPKGTIDIIPTNVVSGDKYTNQDTVLINLNVTDNQTEQARIMYALYNEEDYEQVKAGTKEIEWKQYIPTVTWTLKEPQGINIIYAVFKDTAGNVTMTKGAAVQKP